MNKVPGSTDRGNTKVSLIPRTKYLGMYIYKYKLPMIILYVIMLNCIALIYVAYVEIC